VQDVWTAHWGLNGDPFLEHGTPYVALPGHVEAVARLVHTIEAGQRLAVLTALQGMGKTRVVHRALAEARHPSRRFAVASGPLTGELLPARLAAALGSRTRAAVNPGAAWRSLEQAVRVCAFQGFQAVLVIDRGSAPVDPGESIELHRFFHLGESGAGRVTVVIAAGEEWEDANPAVGAWTLAIRLRPLSFSETELYLSAKLAAAGCRDAIFTSRALARLHLHSAGSPRGLDRLASLALLAGASRGLEGISSEVVDSVLSECHLPPEHVFRA
jgi:MSHA biogenesis protein MshM